MNHGDRVPATVRTGGMTINTFPNGHGHRASAARTHAPHYFGFVSFGSGGPVEPMADLHAMGVLDVATS